MVLDGEGDSIEESAYLAVFLTDGDSRSLSGRLIYVSDDFSNLPDRIPEMMGSEVYELRRVELS